MLFGVKENGQFDLICNDIKLKHTCHEKILGVTIDNKLSFDEHINICKTAFKKLNALSRINLIRNKIKGINIIFHNLSFQLLSPPPILPPIRCFVQKIYQNDKCCLLNIFTDYSKCFFLLLITPYHCLSLGISD